MFKNKKQQVKKSYGIALVRFNVKTNHYELLFIKKRYTYHFVEFVLGHYSKNNEDRLKDLFSGMSHEEKITVLSLDFGKLWYKIWLIDPESSYDKKLTYDEQNRYNTCKKHFEKCFLVDSGERLRNLVNMSRCVETIWELPKGRKNSNETNIDCAIREVTEETGITPDQYRILHNLDPIMVKTFDTITYENYYWIAVWEGDHIPTNKHKDESFKINFDQEFWRKRKYNMIKMPLELKLNFKNEHQIAEVSAIRWLSLDLIRLTAPDHTKFSQSIIKILKKQQIGGLSILRGF